jgi:hypothetical protein
VPECAECGQRPNWRAHSRFGSIRLSRKNLQAELEQRTDGTGQRAYKRRARRRAANSRAARARGRGDTYRDEQVDEIMRTELTRSFCALDELLLVLVPLVALLVVPPLVEPDELVSSVPVISTS